MSFRPITTNLIMLLFFLHMGKNSDFIAGYTTSIAGMIGTYLYYRIVRHEAD